MWRNDGMKPVPESMTHFPDFDALFGVILLQAWSLFISFLRESLLFK